MANEQDPSGTPPAPGAGEQQQPKFMTADEFNGAMTARDRRFEQRMAKQLEEFQSKLLASFQSPKSPDGGDEAEIEPGAVEQPTTKKLTPAELAAKKAMAKVETLTRQMAAKEQEAAREKAELLAKQDKAETMAALVSAGVTTAKGAYATLKEDGRIRRNANGELVMVVMKEYGEDEMSIADGIKHWLGTDDGKHFAPPRGGGEGSGTVVRGGAPRTGAPLSKEEQKREAQKTITKFILGGG